MAYEVVYTQQAVDSLEEALAFISTRVSAEKLLSIRNQILDKADELADNPWKGQREEYLTHLGKEHRRIVEGNYKIIYRVEDQQIYITDIFDSRQDPEKMKG